MYLSTVYNTGVKCPLTPNVKITDFLRIHISYVYYKVPPPSETLHERPLIHFTHYLWNHTHFLRKCPAHSEFRSERVLLMFRVIGRITPVKNIYTKFRIIASLYMRSWYFISGHSTILCINNHTYMEQLINFEGLVRLPYEVHNSEGVLRHCTYPYYS